MSSCPTCNREYTDETMRFCLDDGTPLVAQTASAKAGDATWQLPSPLPPPATVRSTHPPAEPRATMTALGEAELPQTGLPGAGRRSSALLFVLGAVILGVAAVAVAFIATRNRGQDSNANQLASASPSPSGDSFSGAASTSAPNSNGASTPDNKSTVQSTPSQKSAESPALTQEKKETPFQRSPSSDYDEIVKPTNIPKDSEPPPAPRGKTVSAGVMNGKATYLAKPHYPAAAKAVRASGRVTVQVLIDENGNVISASAVSGHALLHAAAVSAARASKFTPTTLSGMPVRVTGTIVYNFVAD